MHEKLILQYYYTLASETMNLNSANSNWYKSLKKSSLTPPNWVFPIAWTILYATIIASGVIFLINGGTLRSNGFFYYCIAWVLNLSWSPLFFRYARPDLSFVVIIGMLIFIALNIQSFYSVNKLSSHLLMPYFAWVLFATYLNGFIVFMN